MGENSRALQERLSAVTAAYRELSADERTGVFGQTLQAAVKLVREIARVSRVRDLGAALVGVQGNSNVDFFARSETVRYRDIAGAKDIFRRTAVLIQMRMMDPAEAIVWAPAAVSLQVLEAACPSTIADSLSRIAAEQYLLPWLTNEDVDVDKMVMLDECIRSKIVDESIRYVIPMSFPQVLRRAIAVDAEPFDSFDKVVWLLGKAIASSNIRYETILVLANRAFDLAGSPEETLAVADAFRPGLENMLSNLWYDITAAEKILDGPKQSEHAPARAFLRRMVSVIDMVLRSGFNPSRYTGLLATTILSPRLLEMFAQRLAPKAAR